MKKKSISLIIAMTIFMGIAPISQKAIAYEAKFNEDFESGSDPWTTNKGTWGIVNDDSKAFTNTETKKDGLVSRGDVNWKDYTVEGKLKAIEFNGSKRAALCGRVKDSKNYYAVALSEKNGVELIKVVKGKTTVLGKVKTSILENTWYDLKLDMSGSKLKAYLNGKLVLEKEDTSLTNGAVALMTKKVNVLFDDIKVTNLSAGGDVVVPVDPTPVDPTPVNPTPSEDGALSKYSVTGFSAGNVGGGVIDENSVGYAKVTNATELANALKKGSGVKVIEIANDIDLGWNMLPDEAKKASVFTAHNSAITHPLLKKTGVSKAKVNSFDGLTIYSKNGAKLTHAGFSFKGCKNVVVRNITFDEFWEWDESTKGNYDRNDWDYVTIEGCNKVWIDHCTFGKAYDGIIDSKKGTKGLTISWCRFLPGDPNTTFFKSMFDEMENNKSAYPMYNYLRGQGLSMEDIMQVAAPQKKTHLIGSSEFASDNKDLELTLHHNYYKDSQDRMPRLRGGNAHVYNVVMDADGCNAASKVIPSDVKLNITNAGYHFGISTNGALSTEGGALLLEKSVILGVKQPLKNNQKSVNKSQYTGKIEALDTIYNFEDINFRGNSTTEGSPLSPTPAEALPFSWNGFNTLPYSYKADDPSTLVETLNAKDGAGAGTLGLTVKEWLTTNY